MPRTIVAETKHNCEHLLGQFLDESHYDTLIESDCSFYAPNSSLTEGNGDHNLIFTFRKDVFSAEEQRGVYEGLIGAAGESQNRGMAAGPKGEKLGGREWVTDWQLAVIDAILRPRARIDGKDALVELIGEKGKFKEESTRGLVWLRSKIIKDGEEYEGFFDRWLERTLELTPDLRAIEADKYSKTCISQTSYANPVNSGIAGFFDRYPRYPYGRVCSYNWKNPELFEKAYPYIRKLDKGFKVLVPDRYAAQRRAADKLDSRFTVAGDTVFTTLTINKNFRTAAHRDAGDLNEGFSNLGVISTGKDFTGGYLVLPEFRVAVNIRPGDLLLINNHEGMHGNTPIESVTGNPDDVERMSIVVYFREKMLELGSYEYETARRQFVESRRLNQEHFLWRPLWNGVSEAMFDKQEWFDFLNLQDDGEAMLKQYHPNALKEKAATLGDFFL